MRLTGKMLAALGWAAPALLVGLAAFSRAHAHPFLQNSWYALVESNRVVTRVTATLREVAVVQQLPGTNPPLAEISRALERHADYVLDHVSLAIAGQRLAGTVLDFQLLSHAGGEDPDPAQYLEQTRVGFDVEYLLPAGAGPRRLVLAQNTLAEHAYAPGIPWDVTYLLEVRDPGRQLLAGGLVRAAAPVEVLLAATAPAEAPPPAQSSAAQPPGVSTGPAVSAGLLADYLRHGIHHVATGYDHLLFLAALTLAAARFLDLLKVIGVFTVAHSLTVTVATLGWVRVPPWIVEPAIAASLVGVAVINLRGAGSPGGRGRWSVVFAFGLLHGLGFAGALAGLLAGGPPARLAGAILAFCAGVEIGHLAFGAPFFGLLAALRHRREPAFQARLQQAGSWGVAVGGMYFLWAALRSV